MYTFEPETKKLTCVSCLPNGETPTDNVQGSLAGLFMSNDGRTFFYTTDPLVPRDTDGIHDVYEYTEGQAAADQLGDRRRATRRSTRATTARAGSRA